MKKASVLFVLLVSVGALRAQPSGTASNGPVQKVIALGATQNDLLGGFNVPTALTLRWKSGATLQLDDGTLFTVGTTAASAFRTAIVLGNVNNTSDLAKPVSTATQTALDLKANLVSPTFTGTPAAPTAAVDTATTQLATTAYVIGQGYLKSAAAAATYSPLAGSGSIVTVGTIGTGVWHGTVIGATYGGFAADISAANGVPLFASGVAAFTSTNGTGTFVRTTSAALVTPSLGVATATSVNGLTLTTGTGTLTLGASTLTASNPITLATDGTGTRTLNIAAGGTLGTGAFQPQTILSGTANQIGVTNSGVGATTVSIVSSPTLPGATTTVAGNITVSGTGTSSVAGPVVLNTAGSADTSALYVYNGGVGVAGGARVGTSRVLNFADAMFSHNLGAVTGADTYQTYSTANYAGMQFYYIDANTRGVRWFLSSATQTAGSAFTPTAVASMTPTVFTIGVNILGSGGTAPTNTSSGSNQFTAGIATNGPIYSGAANVAALTASGIAAFNGGNAATSSAVFAVNNAGAGGTVQRYYEAGNGAGFVSFRIVRGNGAANYGSNGLSVDSYDDIWFNLNALGGAGGKFTVAGGTVNFTSTTEATTGGAGSITTAGGIFATKKIITSSQVVTGASTTSLASLNLPHGSAPTSPVNGDIWTTTAGLFVRINGATVGPLN